MLYVASTTAAMLTLAQAHRGDLDGNIAGVNMHLQTCDTQASTTGQPTKALVLLGAAALSLVIACGVPFDVDPAASPPVIRDAMRPGRGQGDAAEQDVGWARADPEEDDDEDDEHEDVDMEDMLYREDASSAGVEVFNELRRGLHRPWRRGNSLSLQQQMEACLSPSTWSVRGTHLVAPKDCPIRNFYRVSSNVVRGGRPTHGFAVLQALGVKTVINLEDHWSATPWRRRREQEKGAQHGINVILTPLSPLFKLDQDIVFQTLRLLADPARRPVFIHCRFGHERTGLLVAFDQIINEGWCPRQAYRSMLRYGFRPNLVPVLHHQFFDWANPYCAHDRFTREDARAGRY